MEFQDAIVRRYCEQSPPFQPASAAQIKTAPGWERGSRRKGERDFGLMLVAAAIVHVGAGAYGTRRASADMNRGRHYPPQSADALQTGTKRKIIRIITAIARRRAKAFCITIASGQLLNSRACVVQATRQSFVS